MSNFNIETILDFKLPAFRCENCLALWSEDYHWQRDVVANKEGWVCAHCGVKYLKDESASGYELSDYLDKERLGIHIDDPLRHARTLAKISKNMALKRNPPDNEYWSYPYIKALLQSFSVAQSFVHFTSFGITDLMVGVLKLLAQRIDVRGVVSMGSSRNLSRMLESLNAYKSEAGSLDVRILASDGGDLPHQKLVIIDGMFGFKGSANLSQGHWRKAEEDRDQIETVTKISDVIELNNRFFSSAWKSAAKENPWFGVGDKRYENAISVDNWGRPWDGLGIELWEY